MSTLTPSAALSGAYHKALGYAGGYLPYAAAGDSETA